MEHLKKSDEIVGTVLGVVVTILLLGGGIVCGILSPMGTIGRPEENLISGYNNFQGSTDEQYVRKDGDQLHIESTAPLWDRGSGHPVLVLCCWNDSRTWHSYRVTYHGQVYAGSQVGVSE